MTVQDILTASIIFGVLVGVWVIYLFWLFIKSAVRAGVREGCLQAYADLHNNGTLTDTEKLDRESGGTPQS